MPASARSDSNRAITASSPPLIMAARKRRTPASWTLTWRAPRFPFSPASVPPPPAADPSRSQTAAAGCRRVAVARAALLFLRGHQRDALVVTAFLGDGARAGGVAVRPDSDARVCSRLEQESRHLDV